MRESFKLNYRNFYGKMKIQILLFRIFIFFPRNTLFVFKLKNEGVVFNFKLEYFEN
jgi:hypothetical protein